MSKPVHYILNNLFSTIWHVACGLRLFFDRSMGTKDCGSVTCKRCLKTTAHKEAMEARQIMAPVHYKVPCTFNLGFACGLKSVRIAATGNWSKDPENTTCGNCKRTDEHKKAMEAKK